MEWEAIQKRLNDLLEKGRHGELRGAMMMLNEVDIAQYMEGLDKEKLLLVFRILPKDISADVFSYMSDDQKQTLIESIGDQEIRALIDDMFLDDAVDFLEEMPSSVVRRVLQTTDTEKRNLINQFLRYPDNSAGSLMTIEYLEFFSDVTVRGAMDIIRREGLDKETIYTLYIVDSTHHLIGTLALRRMILASEDTVLSDIMDRNPVFVHTLDDQEKVAEVVRHYDLMAIPVVDKEDRLVGIITADDIMDVIEEETTEDFEKMAALTPSDDEYLKTSPFKLALNRIPWLLVMAIIAIFTGLIITQYEDVLQATGSVGIILTSCIPMLMDTGGNCGAQSSTLIIRGLSLGQITLKDFFKALWKEFRVAVIVGAVLFVFTLFRVKFVNPLFMEDGSGITWAVAFVVASALFGTIMLAKALGCAMPMLAKRLKLDPALMASPMITTVVDMSSLFIYFSIAKAVLKI
ncbi:MAG: magnesium transporter [Clostridia bacterium]|nr:magnesium transporter [Clostridia bacterium]MBR0226904.1 magnesium transporter [Clostridia bacterium]